MSDMKVALDADIMLIYLIKGDFNSATQNNVYIV
jgi:hypothetical protein